MNPRHELVNWDGAAGLTIDEAIDWLSHCHHSQQVSQNQVNKDVFLQHVVRRFRWVFALAGGQDRIVIAFLQKWLQFMSTYSKHNQTISSRGNAVTLDLFSWTNVANVDGSLLDKVRRLLFKVTLSISVNILNELFHSINISIFGSRVRTIRLRWNLSQFFPILRPSLRWTGVKVQRNPSARKKNIVLMNEKAQTDSFSKSSA